MAQVTILGASYNNVPAVTLPATGGGTATFYEVNGTKTITLDGTTDVTAYQYVDVNVGPSNINLSSSITATDDGDANITLVNSSSISLQAKTGITPTTSSQTITYDSGYDGLSSVQINAIPSSYIIPSGSQTITTNNTYDVTNLAQVVVNVGGKAMQAYIGYDTRTANSYGATAVTLTVAKTGTYKISWIAWRSSSSGTMGTNLHIGNSSGTNQQTFTNTYGQCITLTNQSLTAGTVLTLYATSGSNSRSINVGNLIIEEE